MAEAKILVVDDEVGMLTLLRNYLTREGYEVTTAPSAEVALQFLEKHTIPLVLTDLRMPGLGGMGLVREIHAAQPETHVILMTAFGSVDTAIEAVKAGAYHFVTKLQLEVRSVLRHHVNHDSRQLKSIVRVD